MFRDKDEKFLWTESKDGPFSVKTLCKALAPRI